MDKLSSQCPVPVVDTRVADSDGLAASSDGSRLPSGSATPFEGVVDLVHSADAVAKIVNEQGEAAVKRLMEAVQASIELNKLRAENVIARVKDKTESKSEDDEKARLLIQMLEDPECRDLEPVPSELQGQSGIYFMKEKKSGRIRAVVKPEGEGHGQLHHPGGNASPFGDLRQRPDNPDSDVPFNEELAGFVAKELGCDGIIPTTTIGIGYSESFHLVTDGSPGEHKVEDVVRVKLCSIQEYVPNTKPLESFYDADHEPLHVSFDPQSYERACIICWIIGEEDGNSGGFLIGFRGRIYKVDSGLAFGYKNGELVNRLVDFQQADYVLSEESIKIVEAIDLDKLLRCGRRMKDSGKSVESIAAFIGRGLALQDFVKNGKKTIREINDYINKNFDGGDKFNPSKKSGRR